MRKDTQMYKCIQTYRQKENLSGTAQVSDLIRRITSYNKLQMKYEENFPQLWVGKFL
jgi:hypothetical protein